RLPGRWARPEQHELVRTTSEPERRTGTCSPRIGGDCGERLAVERGELPLCRATKADPARDAIDRQRTDTCYLGQRSPSDAKQRFELKGAVLTVAEAETIPGVGLALCPNVGNAPAVAANLHGI